MVESKTLNEEGLFADTSVPTEKEVAEEDAILETDSEEEITSAQKQRSPVAPKRRQDERPRKPSPRKRKQENSRDNEEFQPKKKPRQIPPETAKEIKEKIKKSEESIAKLKTHSEKGTCPKTLRYRARANIAPDEEFKNDISFIRKDAEKKFLDALTKFHYRRIETLAVKLRKLEQLESRRKTTDVKLIKNRPLSAKEHADRIERIQKKMSKLNEEMIELKREQNKKLNLILECHLCLQNTPEQEREGKINLSLLRNAEKENENCRTILQRKQRNRRKNT